MTDKIKKEIDKIKKEIDKISIKKAHEILLNSENVDANLVLLKDKYILFDDDEKSFLMYRIKGKSWIVLGDPIGEEKSCSELIFKFYEISKFNGGRPVFYQIGKKYLNCYLDIGMTLLKIGEEAKLNIKEFNFEGKSKKKFRRVYNKFDKGNYTFEIIKSSENEKILDELEIISKKWLQNKKSKEKSFSLGSFDREYIKKFDIAIIKKEDKIIGFANMFMTNKKENLSVDLMRFIPNVEDGIMDYIFIKLILWGKENDYKWFNLGMAPLAGLKNKEIFPIWNKIGTFIYKNGEHFYNFKGLRQYKEKYDPVWSPRYIALTNGIYLASVLKDIALLISGGLKGLIKKENVKKKLLIKKGKKL